MARDTYAALQAKIEKEIIRLQKQAKALQAQRRTPVITSIIRSMREYDITPEEIIAAFNKKPRKPATVKTTAAAHKTKRPVPVKYRHPDTGSTWTGRGKPPLWITTAEAQGKTRNDFLVPPSA